MIGTRNPLSKKGPARPSTILHGIPFPILKAEYCTPNSKSKYFLHFQKYPSLPSCKPSKSNHYLWGIVFIYGITWLFCHLKLPRIIKMDTWSPPCLHCLVTFIPCKLFAKEKLHLPHFTILLIFFSQVFYMDQIDLSI